MAAFVAGLVDRRATGPAVLTGVASGIAVNVLLYLFKGEVFWMWWNLFGLVVAISTTALVSRLGAPRGNYEYSHDIVLDVKELVQSNRAWMPQYLGLVVYFIAMLFVVIFIDDFLMLFT
ncbi:MAG: hypothetical protein IPJ88_17060 [Myxococcales bacterium]|nr:MAG: hypothetical protein IPJ88_17060 [Myxococcales bacterium]